MEGGTLSTLDKIYYNSFALRHTGYVSQGANIS